MIMTNIEWTVENEIQLFYAMMNHKPIGINKHFQMVVIHDRLTSSLNCELYVNEIWKKLETLYDLQALDESDKLPFPNNEEEFSLPQDAFANLLEDRLHVGFPEDEDELKVRPSKHSTKKDDTKDEGAPTAIPKRDKVLNEDDDEERDSTPRRSLKRARETSNHKSSPSPASSKRRR